MKHTAQHKILITFIFMFMQFFHIGGYGFGLAGNTESPGGSRNRDSISPANTPLAVIPFQFDGRVVIPLKINTAEDIGIILDTGIPQKMLLLMHKETGEELGIQYVETRDVIRGAGSGKNKAGHISRGEEVSLAGIELGRILTIVIDESREESIHHNQGVIGGAVFLSYVVEIDFDELKVRLFDPDKYQTEDGWEEIPLTLERNMPQIEAAIDLGDTKKIPVKLVVDTGAKPTLALCENLDKQLVKPDKVFFSLSGTGLRGDVYADHARISGLKIGGRSLNDVLADFVEKSAFPFLEEFKADGILGLGSLYRFNMIFDYAHSRMFLKPNKHFSDPFEMNMAGMVIRTNLEGEQEVYYMDEGSPAAEKGLKKGDLLVAVNGKAAGSFSYLELKKIFEQEGKTVSVKVQRNGKILEVKLKLKKRI